MVPFGSRLLIGAALVLATGVVIVYGLTQGGLLGTTGWSSPLLVPMGLAAINMWARDSDASAMDEAALTQFTGGGHAAWCGAVATRRRRRRAAARRRDRHLPVVSIFGPIPVPLAATAEWMVQA